MSPDEFLTELGRRIRAHRVDRGLSQHQLAVGAGLSTRYISQIEAGRGNISILKLLELTRALGIPLHEAVRLQLNKSHPIVALLGLRGAGKSTVGRQLAKRLGRPFFELDGLIEDESGLGLAELFSLHGEGYYRRLERKVLTEILSSGPAAVLATGGGLVTDGATYNLLKKSTVTVWLKARPEIHLERVASQGDRRPMAGRADPLSELNALLLEREPLYREADVTIDTSELQADAVADEVLRQLREADDLR